jgi:hypothetical protein
VPDVCALAPLGRQHASATRMPNRWDAAIMGRMMPTRCADYQRWIR